MLNENLLFRETYIFQSFVCLKRGKFMLNIITRYLLSGVIKVTSRNVIIMQTGLKNVEDNFRRDRIFLETIEKFI